MTNEWWKQYGINPSPLGAKRITMSEQSKKLTITLTGRRPIRIAVDDWPITAEATESDHNGEIESQANRKSRMSIRVRQHQDGRAIVYGSYSYNTQWQDERSREVRDGEMLEPGANLEASIMHVAEHLSARIGAEHFGLDVLELGRKCVADLPAEEL